MSILGDVPFCKGCAERYLRVKKKLQGDGHPGPGPANWRESSVLDEFHKWQQQRSQHGQLGIGGDKDLEDFAKERGVGGRGIEILKKHYFGKYQPGDGWKRLYDERRKDHQNNQSNNPFPWPPKKKKKNPAAFAAPKSASRKEGWSGWGPTAARKHDVDGWEWDQRLAAYIATSTPDNFTCKCGAKHKVPSYTTCKCGKIWNSYVIGTGGENRQAAVEKYLCREIPVRDGVIVAGRRRRTSRLNGVVNPPPKDKPVILMYGGGFNPAHSGHAGALQDAYNELAGAGYKVDRSIVVPTADKLLANKLAPQDRLSLQSRANVSRIAFPKDINGSPVDVRTEPSEEVERMEGKPRRTDLAKWAQRQYPNHTIINVTGEDASVPGDPGQYPALYSGAPDSNHAGFSYLTMPRDMRTSISSSKIRAAIAAGLPVPGMTPAAEQAYRAELARRLARRRTADKNTCPACGKGLRDYDLSGTTDHQGQRWCHNCIPAGIKAQMKKDAANIFDALKGPVEAARSEEDGDDFATDEWPSDHHPGLRDKLKATPSDWHHRDKNQRWTAT